jgi:hypothetical protein
MSSCLLAKAVLGLGLGLVLRLDPVLAPLGLGFETVAPRAAALWPFNDGTGFFVAADGTFVSAHHVIGDCRRPAIQTPKGLLPAKLVATSASLDIAIARTETRPARFASFPDRFYTVVDSRLAVTRFAGCGGPDSRDIVEADLLPETRHWSSAMALEADRPIVGGNSGSPVIDAQGRVVGMLVAKATDYSRTGFAVDGATLTGFLVSAGVDIAREPPGLPLSPGLPGALAAEYTFPVVCLY